MNQNKSKSEREPFFIVPSKVFEMNLNPYELSVLFYLMMRADNEKHTCFPSEKGIAKACGMSLATVKRNVKSLEAKHLIKVKKQFTNTKNGMNRQTANLYTIEELYGTPPVVAKDTPPSSVGYPPQLTEIREINETKPNITKSNISISTELTAEGTAAEEKDMFYFLKIMKECFEVLKNERGFSEENIDLINRALQYLWFRNDATYEDKKYTQSEVRELLCDKITPDILASSMKYLDMSSEPIRSPVAYLGKCILGGLVNGFLEYKKSEKSRDKVDGMNEKSSFDLNEFFELALKKSYESEIGHTS